MTAARRDERAGSVYIETTGALTSGEDVVIVTRIPPPFSRYVKGVGTTYMPLCTRGFSASPVGLHGT